MTFRHQKRAVDMTGQRFGRLVVIRRSPSDGSGRARWMCRCDCGGERVYLRSLLIVGQAKSCGCLHRETARVNGATRRNLRCASTLSDVWR